MLRLLTGKAGTGKTAAVISEIDAFVRQGRGGSMLIVPEQYSHEAERELCRRCGDTLSLYAEVFSFTGLARRIMSRQGGAAASMLDKGGRMLCMALALNQVYSRLKVYGAARRKAELQGMLLSAVDELKSAGISAEALFSAGERCGGALGDKLCDMALVLEAYDAAVANGHADPADRLDVLAAQIRDSDIGPENHIYIDGFIDFTHQELAVIRALMKKGAELTVCLTVDELQGDNEIFALSRRAGRILSSYAKELGMECRQEHFAASSGKAPALSFFADNMFSYSAARFAEISGAVELYSAESLTAECEFAAARAIELVRDRGCRWRDIAVAVRGFEDYRTALESIFRHYGVPLFVAKKSELLSKPLPALISGAYEIIQGGWDVDDVLSYMGTGLSGLDTEECDLLGDYVFKWQLRAGAWKRSGDWRQHPDGYGEDYDEKALARLEKINALRRKLAEPLLKLQKSGELAETAAGQAAALSEYLRELKLPEQLARRAGELEQSGRESLAQEYLQLWDIIVSALEQSAEILGDMEMDMAAFSRLFITMLSQYDVGSIPVSLDRVSAGDFDRMRRRDIRHLIVLGATDQRLPRAEEDAGIFSDEERRRLLELDIDIGGAGEGELWREFSLIYNCLSLPSESLSMCYPLFDGDGAALRPAFVFNRAKALFDLPLRRADISEGRMSSPAPALSLAAHALNGGSPREKAAAEVFREREPERFEKLRAAAQMSRGKLSPAAVEALYGKKLRLSASRIDRFSTCKFAYFCQYGLKAKPYEPAGFKPPEIGTFMHWVLERTARDAAERGGFAKVSDEELKKITERHVEEYIHTELNDFQEKSQRFIYLFKRLSGDVYQVVREMAAELRKSDFVPLDFELDFSKAEDIPPVELGGGEGALTLTGVADRVDGWLHEGKLYLRVVDYKTGRKKFSLSDVWYGMGMQMLLYLFALESDGAGRYGREIVPAGVMYVPARNVMLSASRDEADEELETKRAEEARRSGIVLDDAAVAEAWEHGEDKRYIPIRFRYGKPTADSIASAERLGLLGKHIREKLTEMASQLRQGSITADPYYRSQQENACLNCDFFDACHFADGQNGESCRYMPKLGADMVWGMLEEEQRR